MKHFLKKVVLFLADTCALASCILMIERCNEVGIGIEIFTAEELEEQLGIYREQALYISDNPDCVKGLLENGLATLIYYHERNRQESFPKCRYAMENPQDIDAEYLERVFRRYMGLPWDILETKRCRLRETTVGDVETFWEMYKVAELTKYTEGLYPTVEEEEAYIRDYIRNMYHFYEFGVWTILHKRTGDVLGRAGLSVREGYEEPELGYVIGATHQRNGYAYEVCRGILNYAAECLGYTQVGALVHKENRASIGLLEKLGFSYVKAHDDNMDYYMRKIEVAGS